MQALVVHPTGMMLEFCLHWSSNGHIWFKLGSTEFLCLVCFVSYAMCSKLE